MAKNGWKGEQDTAELGANRVLKKTNELIFSFHFVYFSVFSHGIGY